MAKRLPTRATQPWYRGADVPLSIIKQFAREVGQRFHPDKIILFGSHAYGQPHADSDVDILVVMPTRNQIDQATRIDREIDAPFSLDLIVRTPATMAWRLREGDSFLQEVVAKGKVLYEDSQQRATGLVPVVFLRSRDATTGINRINPVARKTTGSSAWRATILCTGPMANGTIG
jgi:predicted nucleotidyltransferase